MNAGMRRFLLSLLTGFCRTALPLSFVVLVISDPMRFVRDRGQLSVLWLSLWRRPF